MAPPGIDGPSRADWISGVTNAWMASPKAGAELSSASACEALDASEFRFSFSCGISRLWFSFIMMWLKRGNSNKKL